MRTAVVLPSPLGPITPMIEPTGTEKLTCSRATTSPKDRPRSWVSIAGTVSPDCRPLRRISGTSPAPSDRAERQPINARLDRPDQEADEPIDDCQRPGDDHEEDRDQAAMVIVFDDDDPRNIALHRLSLDRAKAVSASGGSMPSTCCLIGVVALPTR